MTLIFAAATVMLTIVGFGLVVTSVKAHWHQSQQCRNCRYDLSSHACGDICPECGCIIKEFADGSIERKPWQLLMGFATLGVAMLTFMLFVASLIGW